MLLPDTYHHPKQVALVTNRGIYHIPVVLNASRNQWEARFLSAEPITVEAAYGIDGRGRYRGELLWYRRAGLDLPIHLTTGTELLITWEIEKRVTVW